jgi:hypothetical protein
MGEHSNDKESSFRSGRSSGSATAAVSSSSSASSRSENTGINSSADSTTGSPRSSSRRHQHRKRGAGERKERAGGTGTIRPPVRSESLSSYCSKTSSSSNEIRLPRRANSVSSDNNSVAGTEISATSLCLEDLKKSLSLQDVTPHHQSHTQHNYNNNNNNNNNHYSTSNHFGLGPTTPSTSSNRTKSLTIGHSSNLSSSRSMLHTSFVTPASFSKRSTSSSSNGGVGGSVLPDLFGLEEALQDVEDDELEEGIDKLMAQQMKRGSDNDGSSHSRQSQRSSDSSSRRKPKKISTWKTTFEVDLPRDSPAGRRMQDDPSVGSDARGSLNEHLTVEQDAWAGIDALLDMQSVDGSCAISTTDILPRAIVRAMKRDLSRSSFDNESVGQASSDDNNDEFSNLLTVTKRALENMSGEKILRNSGGGHGRTARRSAGQASAMPSLSEVSSTNFEEAGGGLFDVFHWSEKANVDEIRGRKKKLNQPNKNRVKIRTNSSHSSEAGKSFSKKKPSSSHGKAKTGKVGFSDDCSLPSLSSFQDDDVASRCSTVLSTASSTVSDWDAFVGSAGHGGGGGVSSNKKVPPILEEAEFKFEDDPGGGNAFGATTFVVQEEKEEEEDDDEKSEFEDEAEGEESEEEEEESEEEEEEDSYDDQQEDEGDDEHKPSFQGDGLVLDEDVDRYIREMQAQLPSIAKKGSMPFLAGVLERPSPTSVLAEDEMSAAQELPSLASLANPNGPATGSSHHSDNTSNKKVHGAKEKKKEVKLSLTHQLKTSIKKIRDKKAKSPAGRSEEKYFPDEVTNSVAKRTNTKQSLLTQIDDGVNWD